MKTFKTGAIRDDDEGKLDYEGSFCPLVLRSYAEFMLRNSTMKDGKKRTCGNWKKGVPLLHYIQSKWRHFMTTLTLFVIGYTKKAMLESLNAELFNTMGMMHELLKAEPDTTTIDLHRHSDITTDIPPLEPHDVIQE